MCACGGRGCLIRTISTEMIDLAQPAYEPRLTYPAMIGLAESGDVGMQRLLGDFGRGPGRARFPGEPRRGVRGRGPGPALGSLGIKVLMNTIEIA